MRNIQDQARYYSNIPLLHKNIRAVVHLENAEDKIFWDNQLQHIHQGEYHFVAYSKSATGSNASGCEQCLLYRPYLSDKFFVCMDSDLRELRKEEGLAAENWIARTHAYSWENHYCEARHLQERFISKIKNSDFDFDVFLGNLSKIVYKPLLYLVYCKTPELNIKWNIRRFNGCIPLQPSKKSLENNGYEYLNRVRKLFDDAMAVFEIPEDMEVEGLTEENAYLHIQGHQLYNLVMHVGTMLSKGNNVAFRSEVLDEARHISGYDEIDKVQTDLAKILGVV